MIELRLWSPYAPPETRTPCHGFKRFAEDHPFPFPNLAHGHPIQVLGKPSANYPRTGYPEALTQRNSCCAARRENCAYRPFAHADLFPAERHDRISFNEPMDIIFCRT
jgi:hypothetical protein